MTLHISRKKAHRGTIKLRKNAFGNEHYLSFEVLHGRRSPAYDGMVDDTFRRALVFLRLRPLPSASPGGPAACAGGQRKRRGRGV